MNYNSGDPFLQQTSFDMWTIYIKPMEYIIKPIIKFISCSWNECNTSTCCLCVDRSLRFKHWNIWILEMNYNSGILPLANFLFWWGGRTLFRLRSYIIKLSFNDFMVFVPIIPTQFYHPWHLAPTSFYCPEARDFASNQILDKSLGAHHNTTIVFIQSLKISKT
jgi:hypothetical protein